MQVLTETEARSAYHDLFRTTLSEDRFKGVIHGGALLPQKQDQTWVARVTCESAAVAEEVPRRYKGLYVQTDWL